MTTLSVDLFRDRPLLDIVSYARRGSARRDRLLPADIALIARTVHRAPEVMVKVLTRGSGSLGSVQRHLDYIGRYGERDIETDDGRALQGRGISKDLLREWDLDLEVHRRRCDLGSGDGRVPPKFVHKLMLSMPPGTQPEGVLAAARCFLREEFALKHRYAFVLHTDEPHPHVHVVVKAVSEQGTRLLIKKQTLRLWRQEFARHLRDQGIEANATERAVRGVSRSHKNDGIYRATLRGVSAHMQARLAAVANELRNGPLQAEHSKMALMRTRRDVERGWRAVSGLFERMGKRELAMRVERFLAEMPPARTEREAMAEALTQYAGGRGARSTSVSGESTRRGSR